MPEPTREQIKEAFKATIDRWEKIVEEPDYYHRSECELCLLESANYKCNNSCPIKNYKDGYQSGCTNTPYGDFFRNKTPENALAELNFLRKVYIWWMEKEAKKILDKVAMCGKEEKKEDWVDVTAEVVWITKDYEHANLPHLLYGSHFNEKDIAYINDTGFHISYGQHEEKYKVEQAGQTFRILKKT